MAENEPYKVKFGSNEVEDELSEVLGVPASEVVIDTDVSNKKCFHCGLDPTTAPKMVWGMDNVVIRDGTMSGDIVCENCMKKGL